MAQNQVNIRLVTRNDTAENWTTKNPVLLEGEMGLVRETGLIKVGDGTTAWNNLSYINDLSTATANHYEGAAAEGETDTAVIARVLGETAAEKDDTFIVKRVISGEKTSYTAYVYDGTKWAAMDGNYDASNVYFDKDFIATANIGVVTIPASGSTTISAAGKSVKDVLAGIFAKEKEPAVSNPAVSITASANKAYEVGTKVSPSYSASLSAGSYTYGPATGITAKTWSVTNSGSDETLTTATGTFAEITVADNTNLSITATATYDAGTIPKSNIGNEVPAKQIKAGSASATATAKLSGYRSFFYGVDTGDGEITSTLIRGLTNGGAYNGSKTLNIAPGATAGAKRVIVAFPANTTRAGLKEVLLTSTMNLDITSSYAAKPNVKVEGANGYTAIEYKVFVYQPASIGGDETHKITLA